MKSKSLIAGAAIAGLMSGSLALRAHAANTSTTGITNAGTSVSTFADEGEKKDTHSCKGKNDCKGKGGCKSGDNGCKGKNSCKGKGGCATDAKKPHAE